MRQFQLAIAYATVVTSCMYCVQPAASQGLKERILNNDRVENLRLTLGDVSKSLDADRIIDGATDRLLIFSEQIASISPQLEEMGYRISTLRMQMIPPKGLLRLTSEFDEDAPVPEPQYSVDGSVLEKAILVSASKAKRIQEMLELEYVVLDVEVDVNPSIRISYRKTGGVKDNIDAMFSDIDMLCGQSF